MDDEIKFGILDNEETDRWLKKHFKLSGVIEFESIPENKCACLLITKNDRLRHQVMNTGLKNDFVVLFNPEIIKSEHCRRMFAFIMDEEYYNIFPYPEFLDNKYIDIKFGIDIIRDLLPELKLNYLNAIKH